MTSERCTRVHRARKRRCSLHAQARLRFARCALLRLCRNACRAIFAFALMSKLLDANCLIIEKTNSNGENRRFSTSIPFKYLYNKSGGTISMSPLVFYSVIPKCDSPCAFTDETVRTETGFRDSEGRYPPDAFRRTFRYGSVRFSLRRRGPRSERHPSDSYYFQRR